jgi:GntR family transcriptional regulator / MocR family aminotransferase
MAVRDALDASGETISTPAGDALAHFIVAGDLASHLARAARTYAARRRALIASLRSCVPSLSISGVDAGLHLVADLPPGVDEAVVQRRLESAGLAVDVLGQFATAPLDRRALVCGYALLPETAAAAAAGVIARSLDA